MVTLNNCRLTDSNVETFLEGMVEHHNLVYLDFTGNYLTDESKLILEKFLPNLVIVFEILKSFIKNYDLLEYIGLGSNNLSSTVRPYLSITILLYP